MSTFVKIEGFLAYLSNDTRIVPISNDIHEDFSMENNYLFHWFFALNWKTMKNLKSRTLNKFIWLPQIFQQRKVEKMFGDVLGKLVAALLLNQCSNCCFFFRKIYQIDKFFFGLTKIRYLSKIPHVLMKPSSVKKSRSPWIPL